jgi:outer membrane protein TolC
MQIPKTFLALALILLAAVVIEGRQASPAVMTIEEAVQAALENYPSIAVSRDEIEAAAAGIQLARTAYLPRVDSLAQFNRATRNNVFGLLLPQSVIPSISGPVLGTNNFGTVWSSAVGALVTWEPFDFGLRHAGVSAATAAKAHAESTLQRTLFEIAVATADAYLTVIAAQETVRAAQAAVERAEVITRMTQAQVDAQLRPGADASRAQAELAAARTQLAQAQQAVDVARALLGKFVGLPPQQLSVDATRLLQAPASVTSGPFDSSRNPIAAEQNAIVAQAKAELQILDRAYVPRFWAQGSAYARGTGAQLDGERSGGLGGLAPSVQNYALGLTVSFPLLDLPSIRAKQRAQSAKVEAETARSQQVATDLTAQWNTASAVLEGSRKVAANTPSQAAAAALTTQQATARYQAGLSAITELADAQRLLTQAEIDDALARLNVWRGLLAVAAAAGDIQPFLSEASR